MKRDLTKKPEASIYSRRVHRGGKAFGPPLWQSHPPGPMLYKKERVLNTEIIIIRTGVNERQGIVLIDM